MLNSFRKFNVNVCHMKANNVKKQLYLQNCKIALQK